MEEIEIELDPEGKGYVSLVVYPDIDLAIYNIAFSGGLFTSGKFKTQVIPLSDLDVSIEELRIMGDCQ